MKKKSKKIRRSFGEKGRKGRKGSKGRQRRKTRSKSTSLRRSGKGRKFTRRRRGGRRGLFGNCLNSAMEDSLRTELEVCEASKEDTRKLKEIAEYSHYLTRFSKFKEGKIQDDPLYLPLLKKVQDSKLPEARKKELVRHHWFKKLKEEMRKEGLNPIALTKPDWEKSSFDAYVCRQAINEKIREACAKKANCEFVPDLIAKCNNKIGKSEKIMHPEIRRRRKEREEEEAEERRRLEDRLFW